MTQSRSLGIFAGIFRFWRDERGATAIEYALIVVLIGLVIVGAISAVYTAIVHNYNIILNHI